MKRVALVFLLLVAVLSAALYVRLRTQAAAAQGATRGSGTIEGTAVDVAARIPARIAALKVAEGETVKAGDVLAELECDEPKAALAQAEAALAAAAAQVEAAQAEGALAEHARRVAGDQTRAAKAQARAALAQRDAQAARRDAAARTADRLAQVRPVGGASEQDLDRARTEQQALADQLRAVESQAGAADAQASVVSRATEQADIQSNLARAHQVAATQNVAAATAARDRAAAVARECVLKAPIDGVVEVRDREVGESVLPGGRLYRLLDLREVRATFYVPNAELGAVAPGRAIEAAADAFPARRFAGVVRRIGAQAEFTPHTVQTREDRDRLVYAVEVTLPNGDGALRPGMPVEISVPGTARP